MKTECAKVSVHNKFIACGLAVLTALSAVRLGNAYGWDGSNPGTIDNIAIALAVVGFAVSLLCVLSVPLNRVAWARLASGATFASYSYLTLTDKSNWGWAALYAVSAVVASWRIVEEGLMKEVHQL